MPAERAKEDGVKFLKTLFGIGADPRAALLPLYGAVVAEARRPVWYAQMGVPDTLDGRFDMVAAILALVLLRLEAEGERGREPSARLTEVFIEDMDGQLREIGVGDVIVGKHIGNMMAAMGGRLTAYREAIVDPAALGQALVRNLWRGEPGADARPMLVAEAMQAFAGRLTRCSLDSLLAGNLPG